MKIYTTYSETHKVFLPWFNTIKEVEPSITPEYIEIEQKCKTGEFASDNWNEATKQKISALLDIISSTTDDYFIFSDVDVQFFKPVWDLGARALENHDIVFQNDYYGLQCTGFFYCKNNDKVKKLFNQALEIHEQYRDDQTSIQAALNYIPGLRHALLPKEYFTFGMYYNHWHGQRDFKVPSKMVVHHANWVKGIANKLELLKATRYNYAQNNFI
jgi:hypothetical protein